MSQEDLIEIQNKEIARLQKEYANSQKAHLQAIAEKDRQIVDLNRELSEMKGTNLKPETKQILKFYFDRHDGLTSKEIAQRFKLSPSDADYHVDVLLKKEFLQVLTVGKWPRCCINDNGRDFVKNRMA
jgi:DNA-directed RNA polymerase specialized sigma subunit